MVAALKWEVGPPNSEGNILTTELNSLANNAISGVGTEFDNSAAADLHKYYWLKLSVTFGSSPSDTAPFVALGLSVALDDTNYSDAYVTGFTDQPGPHILIPVRKVTSAQHIWAGPFLLPPTKCKWQLDNQTGVAFPTSGSTVGLFTNNDESQ